MANVGAAHINVTWDTEPTEAVKASIRKEVLSVLKEFFEDSSWLKELIAEEVNKRCMAGGVLNYSGMAIVSEAGPEFINLNNTNAIPLHMGGVSDGR